MGAGDVGGHLAVNPGEPLGNRQPIEQVNASLDRIGKTIDRVPFPAIITVQGFSQVAQGLLDVGAVVGLASDHVVAEVGDVVVPPAIAEWALAASGLPGDGVEHHADWLLDIPAVYEDLQAHHANLLEEENANED